MLNAIQVIPLGCATFKPYLHVLYVIVPLLCISFLLAVSCTNDSKLTLGFVAPYTQAGNITR